MRILMGIPFLYPAISYGGAARAAYELAESLHRIGHEVTVITTDVWDARSRYRVNGIRPPFEVIRVPNLSNAAAYHLQFYTPLGILKVAQQFLSRSDILHLHTFRNILNDVLARGAVKQGVPFVLTGHGTIPRIERFFLIKRFYDLLIGDWQLRHAAGYIAVSAAERRRMRRFGLPKEKISVVPNGIPWFEPQEPGSFRKRWGIGPDEKMILFLGKISRRKGLQHLVRAFARIGKGSRLVIAGNDMGYSSKVLELVHEYRLSGRVLWTGLLGDREKRSVLQDADLTVYPSVNEVFGLVPLESIIAGTPVIVCDDDGCGEVIRKVGAGDLVPWGDVQTLAEAIRRRLAAGKNETELARAQERIRVHFTWRLIARKTANLYGKVVMGNDECRMQNAE